LFFRNAVTFAETRLLLYFYNAEQLEQLSLMEQAIRQVGVDLLSERYSEVGLTTRYYTTELHY